MTATGPPARDAMTGWSPQLLGVHLAGWPAFVVDAVLRRHLAPYLEAMHPARRREMVDAHAAIRAAAAHYDAHRASVASATEAPPPELVTDSASEVTTGDAAVLLELSARQVCNLAARWSEQGLARKVGRNWLIDLETVREHEQRRTGVRHNQPERSGTRA